MDDYNSSDDLDDDWFYESVMRYNTLQMFYLQNIPEHILQLDEYTVCTANKNDKLKNTELLQLRFPPKLTVPLEDEGRSKENDFKILSGLYVEKPICHMDVVRGEKKIITSQISRKGLQVYNFHPLEAVKNTEHEISETSDWETPEFTINQEEKKIICSHNAHEILTVIDLNTEKGVKKINPFKNKLTSDLENNKSSHFTSSIKYELIDQNILAVLDCYSGVVHLNDLRTNDISLKYGMDKIRNIKETWTLSKCDFNMFTTSFGILSNKGNFCIFDLRINDKCIKNESLSSPISNFNTCKLKIASRNRFSISGFDSNIYVYNLLNNSFNLAFTHNGHTQNKVCDTGENIVNDHIWLLSIGSNFIASICNNKSLNCWEYNESANL